MSGDAPLYPEALVGWRTWTVPALHDSEQPGRTSGVAQFPGGMVLVTGHDTEWPRRVPLEAGCRMGRPHRSPDPNCSCGIYAARTLPVLRSRRYAAGPHDSEAPDVVGEIALWGRIMESTEILRAEFAYPKRLYVAHTRWQLAKPLGEAYGVPVEIRNPFTLDDPQEGDDL
jgi:hypothetical protein